MKVHIGKVIREKVRAKGWTVVDFARKINYSRRNVYVIFDKESLNTGLLIKLGKLLDYDFFHEYVKPAGSNDRVEEPQETAYFQKQIEKLKQKIEQLEKENVQLKEAAKKKKGK